MLKQVVVKNWVMRRKLLTLSGSEFHALLLLTLIAKPDAHNVLFEVELLGDLSNLLARRSRLRGEILLEQTLLRRCNRRSLPLTVQIVAAAAVAASAVHGAIAASRIGYGHCMASVHCVHVHQEILVLVASVGVVHVGY